LHRFDGTVGLEDIKGSSLTRASGARTAVVPTENSVSADKISPLGYDPYIQFPWSRQISDEWSLQGMFTFARLAWVGTAKALEPGFPCLVVIRSYSYIGPFRAIAAAGAARPPTGNESGLTTAAV